MNCLCLFKGDIQLPNEDQFEHEIFIFSELIWYQGKEMEVIGEWKGYSKLTNF